MGMVQPAGRIKHPHGLTRQDQPRPRYRGPTRQQGSGIHTAKYRTVGGTQSHGEFFGAEMPLISPLKRVQISGNMIPLSLGSCRHNRLHFNTIRSVQQPHGIASRPGQTGPTRVERAFIRIMVTLHFRRINKCRHRLWHNNLPAGIHKPLILNTRLNPTSIGFHREARIGCIAEFLHARLHPEQRTPDPDRIRLEAARDRATSNIVTLKPPGASADGSGTSGKPPPAATRRPQ